MLKSAKLLRLGLLQDELCGDFAGRYYARKLNSTYFNEIAQSKHHNERAAASNWNLELFQLFTYKVHFSG